MFSKISQMTVFLLLCLSVFGQDSAFKQPEKKEYTPEQKTKLKLAEELADKFVQRWHETLDLNVLFDEFYSSDPWIRQHNIDKFCDCFDFISGEAMGTCADITIGLVGNETKRSGFMAFWNLYYLRNEYDLAFRKSVISNPPEPEENKKMEIEVIKFQEKFAGDENNEKRITRKVVKPFVQAFIDLTKRQSAIYRKHLPRQVFDSENYKYNLARAETDQESPRIIIDGMGKVWRLEKGQAVYCVQRGGFELYVIEERSGFRLLTIGYEL